MNLAARNSTEDWCCRYCFANTPVPAFEHFGEQLIWNSPFIVCTTCGNKRCPHGSDHRLDCTDSNEPGQPGRVYF